VKEAEMKKIISLFFLALIVSGCATPQVPFRTFQASVPAYNAGKYPLNVMIRITREDVDMQSSSDMLFVLPAPVAGGKVQTYVGKYFGKMLLQGTNSMFKSATEYIGPLQYPGKMQALLGAVKDKSVDLIILGMPREVKIIELKNMDGVFGATYGLGKNEPWNMSVGAKTEIMALNDKGQVIYRKKYLDSVNTSWKQWRALGQADAAELFCAVHGAYDNIFEKQVSKFLFELSESNNFKRILKGDSNIEPVAQTESGEELTFEDLVSITVLIDSEPPGAEVYQSSYPIKNSWRRLFNNSKILSSDITPMKWKIAKEPSPTALVWEIQARKEGYYDSEIITIGELYKKRKHVFILKKKEN